MSKVVIMGYGEVGEAIGELEKDAGNEFFIRDLRWKPGPVPSHIDFLHVCIPENPEFAQSVFDLTRELHNPTVIIHSTITSSTMGRLLDLIEQSGENIYVYHSPVSGVHPNLKEGIKTFTKFISGPKEVMTLISVKSHFRELGIEPEYFGENYEETIAAKLWDTTYYGWNILFAKLVKEYCDEHKIDFYKVYKYWNSEYNKGYQKLGKGFRDEKMYKDDTFVLRPILNPPTEEGIGGHCVQENARLLFLEEMGKDNKYLTKQLSNILEMGKFEKDGKITDTTMLCDFIKKKRSESYGTSLLH